MKIPCLINNSATDLNVVSNSFSIATKIFDQHTNIINIKKKNSDLVLNLKKISRAEVEKVINNLTIVSAYQKDDIPTKVIKMNNKDIFVSPRKSIQKNKDIFACSIAKDFNNCVDKGVLSDNLKHADVTPVHKKKDKSDKTNYRPKIILTDI